MSANGVGMLVGPPIGGFMYEYAGYKSSFILCAGIFIFIPVLALVLILFLPYSPSFLLLFLLFLT